MKIWQPKQILKKKSFLCQHYACKWISTKGLYNICKHSDEKKYVCINMGPNPLWLINSDDFDLMHYDENSS